MEQHHEHDWKKYLIVFLITLGIFFIAIVISTKLSDKRFQELRAFQDKLTTDILSSETRFALLERTSCKHFIDDAILTEELGLFGDRLASMERQLDAGDPDVEQLKRYYSLLQIKDYLLVSQLAEKCNTHPVVIIYFYSQDCTECERQGYVLADVQKDYPNISVYGFDYDTELSAVRTLASTLNVTADMTPVLIINDQLYSGGVTEEKLRSILDSLVKK